MRFCTILWRKNTQEHTTTSGQACKWKLKPSYKLWNGWLPRKCNEPWSSRTIKSLIRKIEHCTIRSKWLNIISKMQIRNITWVYCPGHSGIVGSKKADKLTPRASPLGTSNWTNKTYQSFKQQTEESESHAHTKDVRSTPVSTNLQVLRGNGSKIPAVR